MAQYEDDNCTEDQRRIERSLEALVAAQIDRILNPTDNVVAFAAHSSGA